MASESTFERLTNTVLESAEKIATRIEEGLSVILTGALPGEGVNTAGPKSEFTSDDEDIMTDIGEDMMGSPLEGIADGVLSDIMSKGVSKT